MTRTFTVALALLGVASLGSSSCKQSDSVVVVDVEADPGVSGIVQLRAIISNAGGGETRFFPTTRAASPIPLPTAFSVTLAPSRAGALDVALDGLGAGNQVLASGADTVVIVPGGRAEVHLRLHAGASLCGNGTVDSGEACDDGDRISNGTCDFRCARRTATTGAGGSGTDASSGDAADRPGGTGGAGGAPVVDAAIDRTCSVELLVNGNFDQGVTGWTASSAVGRELVRRDDDPDLVAAAVTPQSPSYLGWLGGADFETATLSQQVRIPADAVTLTASGFVRIRTGESDFSTIYDAGHVELVRGTIMTPFAEWSNEDATDTWSTFGGDIDAVLLRGTTLTFQLRATTDDGLPTNFFLDDVSLIADVCP